MTTPEETLIDLTRHITTADIEALRYLKNQIDYIGTLPNDTRQIILRNLVANVPDVPNETFLLISEVLFYIIPSKEIRGMSNVLKMKTILQEMTGPERITFFIAGITRAMTALKDRKNAIERALHIFDLYCYARPDEELADAYEQISALLDSLNEKSPYWRRLFLSEPSIAIIDQFYDKLEEDNQ